MELSAWNLLLGVNKVITEYEQKLLDAGFKLQKETIKSRWSDTVDPENTKQIYKVIVDADLLGIDISDLIARWGWRGEVLQDRLTFNQDEETSIAVDHFDYVMDWHEKTRSQTKAYMVPLLDFIAREAIEFHSRKPMLSIKGVRGIANALNVTVGTVRNRLQKLCEIGSLKLHESKGRRANGLSHANRYELSVRVLPEPEQIKIEPIVTEIIGPKPRYDW